MAKTKKETKAVDNAELEALVDEGKNVDTVKVAEIITNNEEDNKDTEEVEVEDLVQEAKDAQAEEIVATVMGGDEEDDTEEECDVEDPDAEPYEEVAKEDCNIDDVISECTGEMDVKEEVPKKKQPEPWFMARAKRVSDYYNW